MLAWQSQLLSQIASLESNLTKFPENQAELNSKKQKLKDLQSKEKTLLESLPIDTQISLLKKEIKDLENKPNKNQLENKKKQLEELLKKQSNSNTKSNDRTGLYVGLGVVGTLVLLLILILARNRQKRLKK